MRGVRGLRVLVLVTTLLVPSVARGAETDAEGRDERTDADDRDDDARWRTDLRAGLTFAHFDGDAVRAADAGAIHVEVQGALLSSFIPRNRERLGFVVRDVGIARVAFVPWIYDFWTFGAAYEALAGVQLRTSAIFLGGRASASVLGTVGRIVTSARVAPTVRVEMSRVVEIEAWYWGPTRPITLGVELTVFTTARTETRRFGAFASFERSRAFLTGDGPDDAGTLSTGVLGVRGLL